MQIKIDQSYKRLDKFLFQYFESIPLSLLQRLIRKYKIKINNKKSKANSPLIKGDVVKTLPVYLNNNKGFKISLLHLDLDIFRPTKFVLEKLLWAKKLL